MSFWLLKSEPQTYGFSDLKKDKRTPWNGIRNFQARGFIREMKVGDTALIYHSGKERAVVGLARVVSEPYKESDPSHPGEWLQFDLEALKELKQPVTLKEMQNSSKLSDLKLLTQPRLSVMPVTKSNYDEILRLGDKK